MTAAIAGADSAVDTVVEAEEWAHADLPAIARRACDAALEYLGCPGAEIVVLGCDDGRIATLNADFRGIAQPTNVLSWPAVEPIARRAGVRPVLPDLSDGLGDIAIAYGTCRAEAAAQGKALSDHVSHLLIHAVLHLAGYDHENDPDAALMEQTEREILSRIGVADPYRFDDAGPAAI